MKIKCYENYAQKSLTDRLLLVAHNLELAYEKAGVEVSAEKIMDNAIVLCSSMSVAYDLNNWLTIPNENHFSLEEETEEPYVTILSGFILNCEFEFTAEYAATEWLKIRKEDCTTQIIRRVSSALKKLGCTKVERRNEKNRFVFIHKT